MSYIEEANRQARIERRLEGIADPTNQYPAQDAVFAEALLMLICRCEEMDSYAQEQAEYG